MNLPADGMEEYTSKDAELVPACCEHLQTGDPDIVFLYQGQVDERGHAFGFHPTVKQYMTGIENVDANIGGFWQRFSPGPLLLARTGWCSSEPITEGPGLTTVMDTRIPTSAEPS